MKLLFVALLLLCVPTTFAQDKPATEKPLVVTAQDLASLEVTELRAKVAQLEAEKAAKIAQDAAKAARDAMLSLIKQRTGISPEQLEDYEADRLPDGGLTFKKKPKVAQAEKKKE